MAGLRTVILLCCIVCDEHNLLCERKKATEDVRFTENLAQKFTCMPHFQNPL